MKPSEISMLPGKALLLLLLLLLVVVFLLLLLLARGNIRLQQ